MEELLLTKPPRPIGTSSHITLRHIINVCEGHDLRRPSAPGESKSGEAQKELLEVPRWWPSFCDLGPESGSHLRMQVGAASASKEPPRTARTLGKRHIFGRMRGLVPARMCAGRACVD